MFEMGSTLSSWFQCALPCWFRSAHDQQQADTWRHIAACQPWPTVPCPSAFSQPASQQKVPSSTFLCASLGQLALQLETFSLPFLTHESVPCSLSPLAVDPLSPRETQKISPVSVGYSHAPTPSTIFESQTETGHPTSKFIPALDILLQPQSNSRVLFIPSKQLKHCKQLIILILNSRC